MSSAARRADVDEHFTGAADVRRDPRPAHRRAPAKQDPEETQHAQGKLADKAIIIIVYLQEYGVEVVQG